MDLRVKPRRSDLHVYLLTPLMKALHDEADKERRTITKQLEQILAERYDYDAK